MALVEDDAIRDAQRQPWVRSSLKVYLRDWKTRVFIGFGLGATIGTWYLIFHSNPTFGADIKDWGVLFLSSAGAMVSGTTGTQALGAVFTLRSTK